MHPVNLIASAIRSNLANGIDINDAKFHSWSGKTERGICALTGLDAECVERKNAIGKSFTNIDTLACPNSQHVSIDALYGLKYKWCRAGSWFCDGATFERLDRVGVRNKVFQAEMPPMWTAYATTSYKKHGELLAKVNTGNQRIWLFEMRLVNCSDVVKVNEWWNILNVALRNGIGRTSMEKCDCPPYLMQKVGLKTWLDFHNWAKDKYLSALYSFLCYLLPSQAELKNEAIEKKEDEKKAVKIERSEILNYNPETGELF